MMMQQQDAYGAEAADGDERKKHESSGIDAQAGSAPAVAARDGDSAYRQVERQFKLAPAAAVAKQGKRARKAAVSASTAAASVCFSDATPASQRYAAEFARWQADTIDLHNLDNNTAANRARIVKHQIHPPPRSDDHSAQHTAAASSHPVASAPSGSSAASPPTSWLSPSAELYSVADIPGFFVLRGALDFNAQSWWAWHSLQHYSRVAYTNLSNLEARKAKQQQPQQQPAPSAAAEGATPSNAAAADDAYAAAAAAASSPAGSASPSPSPSPSATLWADYCRTGDERPFRALRWSCLGYAYDWSNREYSPSMREAFPAELSALSSELALACGFPSLLAEAAIVNFYPGSASMGGHIDDAELTKLHPIVSVSLGCTAVFLIGGPEKTQRPQAFYLRSGDVAIMGGESRVCYHGVPRILEGSFGDEQLTTVQPLQQSASQTEQLSDPTATASSTAAAAAAAATPSTASEPHDECKEGSSVSIPRSSSPEQEAGCSKKQKSSLSGPAVDRSRSAGLSSTAQQQQSQPAWSADRCYDRLRLDSAGQPVFPCSVEVSAFPAPTRAELLHVYRLLRRSRLNLNVRQVEDDTFTYAKGLSSATCRQMKLQQQRDMASENTREHEAQTNHNEQSPTAATSMQS